MFDSIFNVYAKILIRLGENLQKLILRITIENVIFNAAFKIDCDNIYVSFSTLIFDVFFFFSIEYRINWNTIEFFHAWIVFF